MDRHRGGRHDRLVECDGRGGRGAGEGQHAARRLPLRFPVVDRWIQLLPIRAFRPAPSHAALPGVTVLLRHEEDSRLSVQLHDGLLGTGGKRAANDEGGRVEARLVSRRSRCRGWADVGAIGSICLVSACASGPAGSAASAPLTGGGADGLTAPGASSTASLAPTSPTSPRSLPPPTKEPSFSPGSIVVGATKVTEDGLVIQVTAPAHTRFRVGRSESTGLECMAATTPSSSLCGERGSHSIQVNWTLWGRWRPAEGG